MLLGISISHVKTPGKKNKVERVHSFPSALGTNGLKYRTWIKVCYFHGFLEKNAKINPR